MFIHRHPYPPFIPENATKLIVGTLPPPRFSGSALFHDDVDFCYGSKHGLLWPILDAIYNLKLSYQNNKIAVEERKEFLMKSGIGICDIVDSCEREKIDASNTANRSIGANPIYKEEKLKNKEFTTLQFRIDQYRKYLI